MALTVQNGHYVYAENGYLPFSRSYTTYYYTSYWTLNIIVTLKRGSEVTQDH